MTKRFLVIGLAALTLIATVVAACGGDDGEAGPTTTQALGATDEPAIDEVRVRLFEWSIDPSPAAVPAGSITFTADNSGLLPHELKIVRTTIGISELPTLEDGRVDEEAEGIEVIGALLDIGDGRSDSGTFDVEAGSYVLLCNIVEEKDTGTENHYRLGMVAAFEVTE